MKSTYKLLKIMSHGDVLYYNPSFGPPELRNGVALAPVIERHLRHYLAHYRLAWHVPVQYRNSDYFGNDGTYCLGVILNIINGWYFLYLPTVPFIIAIRLRQLRSVPMPWSPMLCPYELTSPLVKAGMEIFDKIPTQMLIRFLK